MNYKMLIKIISSKKFNLIIEYAFILPLLYLVQYNYEKYKILIFVVSVFILVKNILIMKITGLFDKKYLLNNKIPFLLIYKIIKMFIGIIFFFFQYKYKFFVCYNVWIANLFYLRYFIKFIKEKYSINSIIKLKKQIINRVNDFTG